MHIFRRLITAIFLTVFSTILLLSAALAYMIVTPVGGKLLVRYFKQEFTSIGLLHVGHYEGSLQDGFVLKDLSIRGLSYIPDALLRIQEVRVRLPLWDIAHAQFSIFNARLFIPDSDPVVFTGDIYGDQIKGNLYARSVDLHVASRFWAVEDIQKNLQGFISDVDVNVQGSLSEPNISGHFLADDISYQSTVLNDGFSRVNLTLMPASNQIQVKGQVMVDSGLVKVRKINLQLAPSRIIFRGDFFNPIIDIHLGSKVEDMNIDITIKGTTANPQLIVTSDPPMMPQEALQILFTGNAWSNSTSPFNDLTSSELAQNFLDYSLQDIDEQQQLGLKTKLTDNLKLGAEMDQKPSAPGETNVYYSHKINGEMDLSEHMSLNISQEVLTQQDRDPSQTLSSEPPAETQVYVQYKKRF